MSVRTPTTCSCTTHGHGEPDGGILKPRLHPKHNCSPQNGTGLCRCGRRWVPAGPGWHPAPRKKK